MLPLSWLPCSLARLCTESFFLLPWTVRRHRFRLGGGALLVMSGPVQDLFMHSVPRRPAQAGERISLTFRQIQLPERQ